MQMPDGIFMLPGVLFMQVRPAVDWLVVMLCGTIGAGYEEAGSAC